MRREQERFYYSLAPIPAFGWLIIAFGFMTLISTVVSAKRYIYEWSVIIHYGVQILVIVGINYRMIVSVPLDKWYMQP
jgi:hypothetical protein